MALKTTDKTEAESAEISKPIVQTTVLELALYKQYTWLGVTYEKGKPYRFQREAAMELLQEQDTGRPVWKIYQAPKQRKAPANEVVDSTGVQTRRIDTERTLDEPGKRIDVGDDSEIQDVLGRQDGGDVTV